MPVVDRWSSCPATPRWVFWRLRSWPRPRRLFIDHRLRWPLTSQMGCRKPAWSTCTISTRSARARWTATSPRWMTARSAPSRTRCAGRLGWIAFCLCDAAGERACSAPAARRRDGRPMQTPCWAHSTFAACAGSTTVLCWMAGSGKLAHRRPATYHGLNFPSHTVFRRTPAPRPGNREPDVLEPLALMGPLACALPGLAPAGPPGNDRGRAAHP